MAKLTESQKREIINYAKEGKTNKEIADIYFKSEAYIDDIIEQMNDENSNLYDPEGYNKIVFIRYLKYPFFFWKNGKNEIQVVFTCIYLFKRHNIFVFFCRISLL